MYKNDKITQEEVKNIMGNLQVEIKDGLIDLNYVGLKIIYARDLKPRAQELVRDYLTHLAERLLIT
jgi:glycerol-3-phosphate dehydrogenase